MRFVFGLILLLVEGLPQLYLQLLSREARHVVLAIVTEGVDTGVHLILGVLYLDGAIGRWLDNVAVGLEPEQIFKLWLLRHYLFNY